MRVELLGAPVDALSIDETEEQVAGLVNRGGGCYVVTLNPEYLYRAQKDIRLMEVVKSANLVTADGEGIVWACRVAGCPVPERVTGIDLMLRLVNRAAREGWKVFLLGAAPGVAEEAADELRKNNPHLQVVGTHHGYFKEEEERDILEVIKQCSPHIIFVAIGAPRQELWISRHLNEISCLAMGVGGSFDVVSGNIKRAPLWIQRLKVEWLYRLLKEPARWRRMLVLPKFVWLVIKKYLLKK